MIVKIIMIAAAIFSIISFVDANEEPQEDHKRWNLILGSVAICVAALLLLTILLPTFNNWVFDNKKALLWILGITLLGAAIMAYDNGGKKDRLTFVVSIIGLIIAMIIGTISIHAAELPVTDVPDETTTEEPTVVFSGTFYNDELQNDGNSDNDFNFGYNRYKAAKNSDEKIADWLDEDFKASIKEDPALAAATMAYADSIIGTRYIGEFYDSAKKDWSLAINNAKDKFIEDSELYSETTDKFIEMLETNAEVSVSKVGTYKDQMYMNPNKFTMNDNGSPDVIALETDQNTGHFLTYSINIKDNKFDVNYRVECGYQPTDVEKTMGIAPTKASPNPGKGGKGNPVPEKGKKVNPKPTPTPTPTPTPDPGPGPVKKDPSKDPVYQGNAQKGGGKNLPTDGPGEYQPTKPKKATDTRTTNDSKKSSSDSGKSAPAADPIPVHKDSHDTGGKGAGDNNGEFKM